MFTGYCIGEYYRDAAEFEARVARCVTIGSKITVDQEMKEQAMLNEKTKEWLERREYLLEKTGYYMSPWDFTNKTLFGMTERPNWKDAAEFEARVSAKLAVESHNCGYCKILNICNGICECERLKYARIEVEEEMSRP